jgi:hypothetical protein
MLGKMTLGTMTLGEPNRLTMYIGRKNVGRKDVRQNDVRRKNVVPSETLSLENFIPGFGGTQSSVLPGPKSAKKWCRQECGKV